MAAASVLLCAPVAQADSGGAVSLSPDHAVALALAAHPVLHAAEAALSTAEASRSASSVFLYNPRVDAWGTPDGSRAELSVGQPLSVTGEGWHARSGARAAVQSADASLSRSRREVAAAVRRAYIDAAVAVGVVEVEIGRAHV